MDSELLYVKDREEWRSWLKANHATAKEIWLVFFKKHTGEPSIPYDDAVEEAICFGWIDSIIKRVDDRRYSQKFTPRRPGSIWSESNKARVDKMIRQGRMAESGLEKIKAAKENGDWEKVYFGRDQLEQLLEMPAELEEALAENQKAKENFEKMAASHKKPYMLWINTAKRSETRRKRAEEAVSLLEKNQKLGLR